MCPSVRLSVSVYVCPSICSCPCLCVLVCISVCVSSCVRQSMCVLPCLCVLVRPSDCLCVLVCPSICLCPCEIIPVPHARARTLSSRWSFATSTIFMSQGVTGQPALCSTDHTHAQVHNVFVPTPPPPLLSRLSSLPPKSFCCLHFTGFARLLESP